MKQPDEGDRCGIDGCQGTFQILPPLFFEHGCQCSVTHPPCSWCEGHEVRCTDCGAIPEDMTIEIVGEAQTGEDLRKAFEDSLVSLDTQAPMCNETNLLRISPELHFPINEVFEVPDEFNGHQRGTFYYRNSGGTLRGPFMNHDEAKFDLCRRPFT